MQVIINFPEEHAQMVIDAICAVHRYNPLVGELDEESQPNSETKAQFAKRMVIGFVKGCVQSYKTKPALASARDTVKAEVDEVEIS